MPHSFGTPTLHQEIGSASVSESGIQRKVVGYRESDAEASALLTAKKWIAARRLRASDQCVPLILTSQQPS